MIFEIPEPWKQKNFCFGQRVLQNVLFNSQMLFQDYSITKQNYWNIIEKTAAGVRAFTIKRGFKTYQHS